MRNSWMIALQIFDTQLIFCEPKTKKSICLSSTKHVLDHQIPVALQFY